MFNYSNLNDIEFEELCKDIMQRKLNEELRTFSGGKDKGIDIRNNDHSIIIQVKHYYKSTYTTLKRELTKEIEKVEKLKPKQYYICISSSLNPMQIDEIYKMFKKYMSNDSNIITIKEIDDFLQKGQNQEIVDKHFKLWLSASNILEKIGQNDIFIDCESLLDNINEEVKYFVKTNMFDKCLEILDNERMIAIVGMPGVGKTTTSKMLILKYVEKGYRVRYSTNNDISNLKKSISNNPDAKEVILLDDCLGQHYLKMEEKHENEIISLIKYIKLHENKVLIMNSRITIFNEAKKRSEEFNNIIEDKEVKIYTINMDNIDFIEKAKILYNHLYFNEIENEYFEEIKKGKRYLNIIRHRNYNPRIIQNIAKKSKINMPSEDYYKYIIECLNNPKHIWQNEYNNRIEKEDRIFLLVLYSMSDFMVKYDLLEKAFNKRIEKETIDTSKNCFSEVIKRLNESMIKLIVKDKERYISVLNPSVNDFLKEEFYKNTVEIKKILESSISIEQIDRLYKNDLLEKEIYIKDRIEDGTILNFIYLNQDYNVSSMILTYMVHFEIKDYKYEKIIEEGIINYNFNSYYIFDDNTTYEKGDTIKKLMKSTLYEYYKIFEKLNNKNFVENLIYNLDIEALIDIIYTIYNKFIINLKKIPDEISKIIVDELNYTLNQYFEEYEIDKLGIDIDELFYVKRKELQECLEYDIYEISEEEFDGKLMEEVEDEVENIVEEKFVEIKDSLCTKLPNEIKKNIYVNCIYINDENIHNYVKKSLEVSRDYDMDSIIESDEDEVEREIDKIFNRLCKNK